MTDAMIAIPKDAPLMIAWEAFKQTPSYENAQQWAAHPEHLQGSLWALFMHGFEAGRLARAESQGAPSTSAEEPVAALFLSEYQREIRELTARADRAEEKGYDDAVNTIEEGFAALLAALNLPADEGDGMDAAPAWIIGQVLKQIADGLKPLGITRDDEHEYRPAATPEPETAHEGKDRVVVPREALQTVLDYYFGRDKSTGGFIIMDCYEKLQSALSRLAKA